MSSPIRALNREGLMGGQVFPRDKGNELIFIEFIHNVLTFCASRPPIHNFRLRQPPELASPRTALIPRRNFHMRAAPRM